MYIRTWTQLIGALIGKFYMSTYTDLLKIINAWKGRKFKVKCQCMSPDAEMCHSLETGKPVDGIGCKCKCHE